MIDTQSRPLVTLVAALLMASEIVAAHGSRSWSPEEVGAIITDSARRAAGLLAAVERHMPPKDRRK